MRAPEWISLVYFGYVGVTALVGASLRNRARSLVASAVVISAIVTLAHAPGLHRLRDWMPALYAVLGYWIPGLLASAPRPALEGWLRDRDAPIRAPLERFVACAPRALLEYLEAAYLCCYPLVPCAFAWLAINGHLAAADRYWTAVLLALFACYGPVAWAPTRPPRAIEPVIAMDARRLAVRPLNARILRDVSIQLNTFPSGHTAGALAAAAIVGTMMPASGFAIAVIGVSIAIASVVGRYHYAADALAGAGVALAAFATTRWWFGAA